MDEIHRQVLRRLTPRIMNQIGNPGVLCSYLTVFTTADAESVKCEERERGAVKGTQELLLRLEKRGKRAFGQFLQALTEEGQASQELAEVIEAQVRLERERRLRRSVSGSLSSASCSMSSFEDDEVNQPGTAPPDAAVTKELEEDDRPISRGSWQAPPSNRLKSNEPPRPASPPITSQPIAADVYNHQAASLHGAFNSNQPDRHALSPSRPLPKKRQPEQEDQTLPNPNQNPSTEVPSSESPPQQSMSEERPRNIEPETLLREIPSSLRDEIVRLMDIGDTLGKDWRGLAGEMNLSVEEVDTLRTTDGHNRCMTGLFNNMKQKQMKVKDLVKMLEKLERMDVISCIENAGYNSPCRSTEETQTALSETTIVVQESSEVDCETSKLPTPEQETEKSQDNATGESEEVVGYPSEEAEKGEDDEMVPSDRLEDMIAPDVFYEDDIGRSALVIECISYRYLSKLDRMDKMTKKLFQTLSWEDVLKRRDLTAATLNREVDRFVQDFGNHVCLVYMVGHTVQINGENYLLPTDIKPSCTRADIMYLSLNINNLVKRLSISSCMQVVIVDGAHQNDHQFQCPGVLEGLASITPPPNAVIAFPCSPGSVRCREEQFSYITAFSKVLGEEPDIPLDELFAKVRNEMTTDTCQPVEFSLLTSLLPISLNAESSEDVQGIVGLRVPTSTSTRHALIFSNAKHQSYGHVARDTEHLRMSLLKLGWDGVETYCDREPEQMMSLLRRDLGSLSGGPMRIVMVYFIGFAQQSSDSEDNHLLGVEKQNAHSPGVDRQNRAVVSTQWLVNLMCEYISGPKMLIVDDLQANPDGLKMMIAPQEVLISLPCKKEVENQSQDQSYTLLLAQLLSVNPRGSLKEIISKASRKQHRVVSNLFYA